MRITVLGSGSGGNCTLVESGHTALLIDAGLSCRQITQRLAQVGRALDDIAGILLTHEHSDHTSALPVLCKTRPVTVYANRLTAEEIQPAVAGKVRVPWQVFTTGSGFTVGDLKVETFSVPHDAQDPVGFIVHNSAVSAGFVTDLGQVTRLVTDRVRALDALVLEANHDVQMLQNDPRRSWGTKQRILSRHGHLSNEDAAKLATEVATDRLRYLVLAHLSRDCNEPKLAHTVVTRQLHAAGATHICVSTARQDEPIATVRL
jgi:phosphoribosyl 1,2-cyclic phosphodiesterase